MATRSVTDQSFATDVLGSDKPVLVDVVKDIAPMMVGGFIYPFSNFATPIAELNKRLGYQADQTNSIKEAKALMKAAKLKKGRAKNAPSPVLAISGSSRVPRRSRSVPRTSKMSAKSASMSNVNETAT